MGERVRRERALLIAAACFIFLNQVTLLLADSEPLVALWPAVVWLVIALGGHLVLQHTLPRRDPLIFPVVMLLGGWGLTLVGRLAPAFGTRQVIWLVVSTAASLIVTLLPPRLTILRRYRYTWLLLGILLLALTIVFGVNPSGSPFAPQLWLGFGPVFFQPSELLKLMLVIFLASYLADRREAIRSSITIGRWELPPLPYLAPMLLMWGFCMVLLVWQRDLGAASLFFLVFLAMLYVATGQIGYVAVGSLMLGAAALVGYQLFAVVRLRFDTWWNPWPEASDRAFQIVQSLLAVASGGVLGQGVGQGFPTFIPVVHSDFVFAAIAEEWGLLGGMAVVACFAILVVRALRVAMLCHSRPFHTLLAAGIGMLLGFQTLMIMGGVLKIVPLTGVTLPFVSYGGSSLLFSFIMVGLLLRISDKETNLFAHD